MKVRLFAPLLLLLVLCACGPRTMSNIYVENRSGANLQNVQVTFPRATRGVAGIAEGGKAHHVVKFSHDGAVKLTFTDAAGKEHSSDGPTVRRDMNVDVRAVIGTDMRVEWQVQDRSGG